LEGPAFRGVPPGGNVVARNVCYGKWLKVYWHATPAMLRLENNLTNALSAFVMTSTAPQAADFEPQPDSPAWRLGFEPLPLSRIGLYGDKLRRAPVLSPDLAGRRSTTSPYSFLQIQGLVKQVLPDPPFPLGPISTKP
jgi:hypothetical protein